MRRRRRKESGFALLLVFLMAAVIGITLYMEVPRVAFDTQRQKEQLLIERGEQYKIAIRRFMQANKNRWPASMDEMESFNNRRFLRHRYKDPMTGKDEWRLIHIQNGVLTDSKLNKGKADQAKTSTPNTFIQEMAGMAGSDPNGPNTKNSAMRTRPSDANAANVSTGGSGVPPDPNNPNQVNVPPAGGVPPYPGQPGYGQPGQPGYPGVTQPYPGVNNLPSNLQGQQAGNNQPASGGFIGNQPGLGSVATTSGSSVPGQPSYPGQFPGQPGMPVNSRTGGVSPYPVAPGSNGMPPGYGQPGMTPGQPGQPNQAIGMINNILTTPRPGGMPTGVPVGGFNNTGANNGFNNTPGNTGFNNAPGNTGFNNGLSSTPGTPIGSPIGGAGGPGGTTIGGGIAGVASNADEDSIMEYADQTNYGMWEFVFDPTKWHAPPNPNVGTIGTNVSQMGSSANNLGSTAGNGTPIGGGIGPGGMNPGMGGGIGGPGGIGGSGGLGGQLSGGQPTQGGTTGMPGSAGSSAFGGGGLPAIRPGRR